MSIYEEADLFSHLSDTATQVEATVCSLVLCMSADEVMKWFGLAYLKPFFGQTNLDIVHIVAIASILRWRARLPAIVQQQPPERTQCIDRHSARCTNSGGFM